MPRLTVPRLSYVNAGNTPSIDVRARLLVVDVRCLGCVTPSAVPCCDLTTTCGPCLICIVLQLCLYRLTFPCLHAS